MEMADKTLLQMYRGGIFDHIGGGFNRYSTDDYFLAPHFEKMLYDYRKKRYHLHLDDKILTSWNGLMIAAMCHLYRVTQNIKYINAAKQAQSFIKNNLYEENSLFVSWRDNRRSGKGFLDDYANEIFALLSLYESTFDKTYLSHAKILCDRCLSLFYDKNASGYAMFLCALLDYVELPTKVTIVLKDKTDLEKLKGKAPLSTIVKILEEATHEYPLINGQTTYYVCKGKSCQPATNISPF